MVRPIQIITIFSALLACAPLATPAGAVPEPDSTQRAALQARIGRLDRVRILGPAGTTLLLEPAVREDGLRMRRPWRPPRAALFFSADAPAAARPLQFVPWSAIEGVQVRRRGARSGALTGATIGGLAAGLSFLTHHHEVAESWDEYGGLIVTYGVVVIGGAALAGLVLGTLAEGWETVWPPPSPRLRP
jgi:hypothetical protein